MTSLPSTCVYAGREFGCRRWCQGRIREVAASDRGLSRPERSVEGVWHWVLMRFSVLHWKLQTWLRMRNSIGNDVSRPEHLIPYTAYSHHRHQHSFLGRELFPAIVFIMGSCVKSAIDCCQSRLNGSGSIIFSVR